jgi:hypothetical protein
VTVDAVMEARWRNAERPFSGVILQSPSLRLEQLRAGVAAAVAILPRAASLDTSLDWHEHDGYVTAAETQPWTSLEQAVSEAAAFLAWSSDDTFVRRAWYPPDFGWLLRWCVSSDPDDFGLPPGGPAGDFDVTASRQLVKRISALVPDGQMHRAQYYFDSAWAG